MLDDRRVFLVPPCDSDEDGELSVLGVRQSRALGNALGDAPLMAIYSGPGLAAGDTAAAVAQRHGLVVRRKPGLELRPGEVFRSAIERIIEVFDTISRAGPGRTSLIVAELSALQAILAYCWGVSSSPDERLRLNPGSITEVTVAPTGFSVDRLGDIAHLPKIS